MSAHSRVHTAWHGCAAGQDTAIGVQRVSDLIMERAASLAGVVEQHETAARPGPVQLPGHVGGSGHVVPAVNERSGEKASGGRVMC